MAPLESVSVIYYMSKYKTSAQSIEHYRISDTPHWYFGPKSNLKFSKISEFKFLRQNEAPQGFTIRLLHNTNKCNLEMLFILLLVFHTRLRVEIGFRICANAPGPSRLLRAGGGAFSIYCMTATISPVSKSSVMTMA